jgi:ferredoxin/flavodoxin---NADP+ reductase
MTHDINAKNQNDNQLYKVVNLRVLTESTFILSLTKCRFDFTPGQYFNLTTKGEPIGREYTIYSAIESENLEFLVKEVEGGYFSPKLKYLKKGDFVKLNGPLGRFCLDIINKDTHKHVFIATGTGIAPFHSMVKSFPGIDYHIIHGVRYSDEAYEKEEYSKTRYTLCTSRDDSGDFNGRLTEYLKQVEFAKNTCFYLCGNNEMIYDVTEVIKDKGFDNKSINVEVYF